MMGSDTGDADEQPVHQVAVSAFDMTKTEVTVAQYYACVNEGSCTDPDDNTVFSSCNWGQNDRDDHPVNCVDWYQASDFCAWAGGYLPSEAEWEYAARSGGQDIAYPWGNQTATCEYAVMETENSGDGCGQDRTWPVCSKVAGNTSQGLCDMAGNVYEWVQDWYHSDYHGAPIDGSAWEDPAGIARVIRGGSWGAGDPEYMRASNRYSNSPTIRYHNNGFRCGRSSQ
jgi:iron(II)-dependent oxidoreductase